MRILLCVIFLYFYIFVYHPVNEQCVKKGIEQMYGFGGWQISKKITYFVEQNIIGRYNQVNVELFFF